MKFPRVPAKLAKKGAVPAAFLAALTGPFAYTTLERLEGNMLRVYNDTVAGGVPTWCAGQTQGPAPGPVGTKLTSDFCETVNKRMILSYGFEVLACTEWKHLSPKRLVALTMFAINVGWPGACGSQAVRRINAGDVVAGCNLISRTPSGAPNWSVSKGKYVQGLQNRRQAETKICLEEA